MSAASKPFGNYRWQSGKNKSFKTMPCAKDGYVYAGCSSGNFFCLDAQTGVKVWDYSAGSPIHSDLAIEDRQVVFTTADGILHCMDVREQTERWTFRLNPALSSNPSIVSGGVYICDAASARLFCLDADTGKEIARFEASSPARSDPCVHNDDVYFGTDSGDFYCLDRRSLELKWSFRGSGVIQGQIAAGSGVVTLVCVNRVFGLDIATGEKKWTFSSDMELTPPGIFGGIVITGSIRGAIYGLNADNGNALWKFDASDQPGVATIWNGMVFFGCKNYKIYCLNLQTGSLIWDSGRYFGCHSKIFVADNRLYYAGHFDKIFCFDC